MSPSFGFGSICGLQSLAIPVRKGPKNGIFNISSSPNSFDRQRVRLEKKSNSLTTITFILFVTLAYSSPVNAQAPSTKANEFGKGIQPILQKYCYDCHGLKKTKGNVKLTEYGSWADLENNPELIEKMIEVLEKNEMPPEEEKQPSGDQRERILLELEKAFKNSMAHSPPVVR